MSYYPDPRQASSDGPLAWGRRAGCLPCGGGGPTVAGACCESCAGGGPCSGGPSIEGGATLAACTAPMLEDALAMLPAGAQVSHVLSLDIGAAVATAAVTDLGAAIGLALVAQTEEGERLQAFVAVDRALYARAIRRAAQLGGLPRLQDLLASRGLQLGWQLDTGRPLLPR